MLLIFNDKVRVDSFLKEILNGLLPEDIGTHPGHEGDLAAQPGGGYGLVGSLSTGSHDEISADNCLTWTGYSIKLDHHVGVRTADNDYFGFIH